MAEKPVSRVTVTILGEDYTIKGTATGAWMQRVARHVDRLMQQLAARNRGLGRERMAVLAAINLADELLRLQEEQARLPVIYREKEKEK